MKQFIFITAMLLSLPSFAQIKSVNLTASGLTCSMCSKAIYKSLVKVPAIKDIKVNINSSSYLITFKDGAPVSLEAIKKAVEDAGFSVATLKVTANVEKTEVETDTKLSFQGSTFLFLNTAKQTIRGLKTFLVVDKNYLSSTEHKKYAKDIAMKSDAPNIYHVTLL
jgi:copper chaperone CopZ